MSRRAAVLVTANFERNLKAIERFLAEHEAEGSFQALLSRLFDKIIPGLEEFPELGPDFLARRPQSMDGLAQWQALSRRMGPGARLREYITDDYLVLYALRAGEVLLLALRHHKQLSFDLRAHW